MCAFVKARAAEMAFGVRNVGGRTASIAFLTRSEVMRPWLARFLIRAAFEEPEDIQAIFCGRKDEC